MGMSVVKLMGDGYVNLINNATPNVRGITFQNQTNGTVFVWAAQLPQNPSEIGFVIKSGEFYTHDVSDGQFLFVKGKGQLTVKF